jgi:hypothetical protein
MLRFVTGIHLQWGDVADWVGSVATSLALLLTYLLLRATRQEQHAIRVEQRQTQARKVSAWCEQLEPAVDRGLDRVVVRLQNASDEPIYDLRVAVGSDWWSAEIAYVELNVSYVIGPHYSEQHVVDIRMSRTADDNPEHSPPVEIIFGDASGNFWHRDRYGGLTEITAALPPSASAHFFKEPANTL